MRRIVDIFSRLQREAEMRVAGKKMWEFWMNAEVLGRGNPFGFRDIPKDVYMCIIYMCVCPPICTGRDSVFIEDR